MTKILLKEEQEFSTRKIEDFMKKNQFSDPCMDFIRDYWATLPAVFIAGAVLTYGAREFAYMATDTALGPAARAVKLMTIMRQIRKEIPNISEKENVQKLLSSNRFKKFISKHKIGLTIVAILGAITTAGTAKLADSITSDDLEDAMEQTFFDTFSSALGFTKGLFERSFNATKTSEFGRETGMQSESCGIYVVPLIMAAAAVVIAMKTKPFRPINRLLEKTQDTFLGIMQKVIDEIAERVLKKAKVVLNENDNIPENAKQELFDIVSTTRNVADSTAEQAKRTIRERTSNNLTPSQYQDCDDFIDVVYDPKDGTWRRESDVVFGKTQQEARALVNKADEALEEAGEKVEKELRKQMDFNFEDVRPPAPKIKEVPDIILRADDALKNRNVKDALKELENLTNFYRQQNLIDDLSARRKVKEIVGEIRAEFPDASDYDIIRLLIERSAEIFTKINLKDDKGLSRALVANAGTKLLNASDEEIEMLLRKQIDEILFYKTANLPLPAPRRIPGPRDEVPFDIMRKQAVNSSMGLFQTFKGKVSPGVAVKLALGALATLLPAHLIYSAKKNRPTGSPFYFEDDSVYDKIGLNTITGQKEYKRIRDDLGEIADDVNVFMFDHKKYVELRQVLEEAANDRKPVAVIDTAVDDLLKKYASKVQDLFDAVRVGRMDAAGLQTHFGDGSLKDINRNITNSQLILEMFLFNEAIINKLNKFYEMENKDPNTPERRLQKLQKIFRPTRTQKAAALRKIEKLDTYFANDYRLQSQNINEVKIMSKKDIRQLVAEVLNENSGQGYGKYPYHSNEYTDSEPDQDYQVEWKAFVNACCGQKRKNIDGDPHTFEDMAVEVAKILVKDSDLLRDVLETAGGNKSIGVEIMQQLKAAKEKKKLDKEMNV